jgi:hypothetical protein
MFDTLSFMFKIGVGGCWFVMEPVKRGAIAQRRVLHTEMSEFVSTVYSLPHGDVGFISVLTLEVQGIRC